VWSWWQQGSVHRARWPDAGELKAAAALAAGGGDAECEDMALDVTADVLTEVRKAKSEARRPMRAPVRRVIVRDSEERLRALELGESDLLAAGSIERIEKLPGEELSVEVELVEETAA
jgi:valyl-tRNA synthetase